MMATHPPTRHDLRQFGLLAGAFFGIVFGLLLPHMRKHPFPVWPWMVGGILWGLALAAPVVLNPVYRVWNRLALVMGWISTRLVLGLAYFSVMTVAGILRRWWGGDPLARAWDKQAKSYRVPSKPNPPESLQNPY